VDVSRLALKSFLSLKSKAAEVLAVFFLPYSSEIKCFNFAKQGEYFLRASIAFNVLGEASRREGPRVPSKG
jgi:hypothetical protein